MPRSTRATPRRGKPPDGWREEFLKVLASSANVRHACHRAGVDRVTAYRHREKDSKFAADWDTALEDAVDLMELAAVQRGVEGVLEPVFYLGKEIAKVKKYSDSLLKMLLSANRPEKYRENFDLELLARKVAEQVLAQPAPERPPRGRKGPGR